MLDRCGCESQIYKMVIRIFMSHQYCLEIICVKFLAQNGLLENVMPFLPSSSCNPHTQKPPVLFRWPRGVNGEITMPLLFVTHLAEKTYFKHSVSIVCLD